MLNLLDLKPHTQTPILKICHFYRTPSQCFTNSYFALMFILQRFTSDYNDSLQAEQPLTFTCLDSIT